MIGKNHCQALFVDVETGKDIVVAWYKLSGYCHRRFSSKALLKPQPILDNRPDIQHTCLRRYTSRAISRRNFVMRHLFRLTILLCAVVWASPAFAQRNDQLIPNEIAVA